MDNLIALQTWLRANVVIGNCSNHHSDIPFGTEFISFVTTGYSPAFVWQDGWWTCTCTCT